MLPCPNAKLDPKPHENTLFLLLNAIVCKAPHAISIIDSYAFNILVEK